MQKVRKDPTYAEKKPVRVYLDMLAAPLEADNGIMQTRPILIPEEMEASIRASIRRSGYQSRRRVISRCITSVEHFISCSLLSGAGVWTDRSVTMDRVPLEYSTLRDGSSFLQHHSQDFISITPWQRSR
ncbi:hypothetical protein COOONC_06333 [Cooperia oncophora]